MEPSDFLSFAALIVAAVVALRGAVTIRKKTDNEDTDQLRRKISRLEAHGVDQDREIEELKGDVIQARRELEVCKERSMDLLIENRELRVENGDLKRRHT